jgi:hypothetical protein
MFLCFVFLLCFKDPLTSLALRASVNGLTDSPFVLYGAHYSSHQHPSSAKAADGHVLSPRGEEEEIGVILSPMGRG